MPDGLVEDRVRVAVVGIGADGWPGLGESSRAAVRSTAEVVGSSRQLETLPAEIAARRVWPSPIEPLLAEIVAGSGAESTCVLASGDPMLHGIGATLARRMNAQELVVYPHPSAFALACSRLLWPAAEVTLLSTVARRPELIARVLQPGRRFVAYVSDGDGASALAHVLRERGFAASRMTVLEQLGGARERMLQSTAAEWIDTAADPLHVVAVECRADPGTRALALVPGLPDDAYANDGQLTKRHVRAVTIAALGPMTGELLWDVGAGSGSIAIEWLRAEPSARAIAIEERPDRAERIRENALTLGVPALDVRVGRAPEALLELPRPNVIFLGGAVGEQELHERCFSALLPGGRLVANAVTLEGERAIVAARELHGGTLTRLHVEHAAPLGASTGWRPHMPVVQWSAQKEC